MLRTGLTAGALALGILCTAAPGQAAMTTPPDDAAIFRTIKEVVSHGPRRIGSPGGDFAVDYVRDRFRAAGLQDVHVEQTPAYSWEAKSHALSFEGTPIGSSPIIYSQSPTRTTTGVTSTPPGGLRAPIVDIGTRNGGPAMPDVRGKIALFDLKFLLPSAALVPATEYLWDPQASLVMNPRPFLTANPYQTSFLSQISSLQGRGAVAVIGVLADYFDSDKYYNEVYRSLNVSVPGLWITKKEGARLRALLAAKPAGDARIDMVSERRTTSANAVVGYLEGKSTDAIMVQSHHDSGYMGAVEDGSGTAEVIALADFFGSQPARSRDKTLMFTTFDSHFAGYLAHQAFGRRHVFRRDPAREPHRIVANVTLEHIAKQATPQPDGTLKVEDVPELRAVFENLAAPLKTSLIGSIQKHDLRRTAVLNATVFQPVGIPTDSNGWLLAGIPTASFISGPSYLYDAQDTLDKVLVEDLHDVAAAFAELVDAIDATPSDEVGLLPPAASAALAKAVVGDGSRLPESTDRVEVSRVRRCRATRRGTGIRALRVRPDGRSARATFTARRSGAARLAVVGADGATAAVPGLPAVRACRAYSVRIPGAARGVRLRTRGRTLSAMR